MNVTILVLRDEAWVSAAFSEILEEPGIVVARQFRSNKLVLTYLADKTPDAAILDFNVADGTSRPTAARLLEMKIPFLVASGYPKPISRDPEFAAAQWLDKPYGEKALMAGVNMMLMPAGAEVAA